MAPTGTGLLVDSGVGPVVRLPKMFEVVGLDFGVIPGIVGVDVVTGDDRELGVDVVGVDDLAGLEVDVIGVDDLPGLGLDDVGVDEPD